MANMSYCRFQNTLMDLRTCHEHILDDDLSPEEHEARQRLIAICREILEDVEGEDWIEDDIEDDMD